jgi:subtilisin family serine protease
MLRNGAAPVNEQRADVSTTVASIRPPRVKRDGQPAPGFRLDLAQERATSLDPGPVEFVAGRLPPREPIEETDPPNESFVNVFVQYAPGTEHRDERWLGAAQGALALAGSALPGTVVPRGDLVSATVPIAMLRELEENPLISFIHAAEPLKLDVPVAAASTRPTARSVAGRTLHRDGEGVIIGVIDVGGFDFSHPDFLNEDGTTRFMSIWDQGGDFRSPPARFGYGSEFRRAHLDRALADARSGGIPATELERQSQRSEASHATHVASIAAGNHGVCRKADIAAVLVDVTQPSDERARRRLTFSDTSRVAHAVDYLLDLADRENKAIAINISLGTNGGAHDGSGGVSRWLDHAFSTPGRAVCLAAGNAGQEGPTSDSDIGWLMGRIHTNGRVAARGLEVDIEWTVIGNGISDLSENEVEIWYGPQDRFVVSVQPPGETRWYEVKPREFIENRRLSDGTTLSVYNELYHPNNGANYVAVYLSPNLDPDNPRGVRPGVWRVRLRGDEIRDGRFHAWIERDDPVEIGRHRGRRFFRFPSFFTETSYVDSHSISSLACGQNVIAVANLDAIAERVNVTTSQGPTRDGRCKPDVAAPGTDIGAASGFSRDGTPWVSMSGTSMASPYVAGTVGLMLAANRDLTAAQCIGILQRTSQPLPGAPFEWQNDTGYGRVDPVAAVQEAATFMVRRER